MRSFPTYAGQVVNESPAGSTPRAVTNSLRVRLASVLTMGDEHPETLSHVTSQGICTAGRAAGGLAAVLVLVLPGGGGGFTAIIAGDRSASRGDATSASIHWRWM